LVYQCKKLVMDRSLNSELNVMANHLSRIALANRHTCDFTLKSLRDALSEIVACFPVYRTYVTEQQVSASDRAYINEAVSCAKVKSTASESSVYDFIGEILLTSRLEGRPQYYQRSVYHFAMRFQQYTSALMAKGLEDTSFYRYNRLISLNEVGGDPLRFGITPEEFHRKMEYVAQTWPKEMVATCTHDSKRSEDVRARIERCWRECRSEQGRRARAQSRSILHNVGGDVEPECEGHAPPPREDGSEDQPGREDAGEDTEQWHTSLHVQQREDG